MWGHREEMAICMPRRGASEGTSPVTPGPRAPSLQAVRKCICVVSAPACCVCYSLLTQPTAPWTSPGQSWGQRAWRAATSGWRAHHSSWHLGCSHGPGTRPMPFSRLPAKVIRTQGAALTSGSLSPAALGEPAHATPRASQACLVDKMQELLAPGVS